MSRLQLARDAVRPSLKARMLLSGPSGAGKTRSALIIATILADSGPILVVDTERESALTYADDFTFRHLPWEPPYDPRDLAKTLIDAGHDHAVVIVDSLSHFWRGEGGTLDIADGKFGGWKTARPAQDDLVDALLRTDAHFIGCSRSKVEHVQEVENGKHVVKKLGMAVIQDDTLEYELNVAAELAMDHTISVAKSRTIAIPVGRTFKAGHVEDFATVYRDWLAGGEPPAAQQDVEKLVARMNALPEAQRAACKQEFLATFGRPDHLVASRLADADSFVAQWEAKDSPPDGGSARDGDEPPRAAEGTDSPKEQSPTGPPPDSIDAGTTGPEGSVPPAVVPDRGVTDLDIHKLAERVFADAKTAAPRGEKSKIVDRCRHALLFAVSKGRTSSLKTASAQEKHRLFQELTWIADGHRTCTVTTDALVIVNRDQSKTIEIEFADVDALAGDAA